MYLTQFFLKVFSASFSRMRHIWYYWYQSLKNLLPASVDFNCRIVRNKYAFPHFMAKQTKIITYSAQERFGGWISDFLISINHITLTVQFDLKKVFSLVYTMLCTSLVLKLPRRQHSLNYYYERTRTGVWVNE